MAHNLDYPVLMLNAAMDQPLVSVLMTAYNREKYIASAIESLLGSSYTDFELIIVDDNSADQTVSIAREYEMKDSRVRVYINDTNLGDYPNRNKAAGYAKGKYLKYVDSDDFIYPDGLEILVRNMEAFPGAALGLCSLKPDVTKPFPFILMPKEAYEYHFFGQGLFHKGPLAAIFVTEAFNKIGGFAPGRMISDIDMWHRMALQYPVVLMQGGIVWQRRHAEQELQSEHAFIYEGEKIKWKYLKDTDCKLSSQQLHEIKVNRLKRYAGFIFSGLTKLDFRQVKIYLKCFWFVLKIRQPKSKF